jgi:hypothetical protein
VDYVSCSPARLAVAQLAAAQAETIRPHDAVRADKLYSTV